MKHFPGGRLSVAPFQQQDPLLVTIEPRAKGSVPQQDSLFSSIGEETVVVFDFETTGMSPHRDDRVIEVGAVRLAGDRVVDSFQSLINPGVPLSNFIVELTGIEDRMLAAAPGAAEVFAEFRRFIGSAPLVAHNAAFDRRFLETEFCRYRHPLPPAVGCSMLAARRVFPEAPNHKLGTLVEFLDLQTEGRFHRALADARMTAALWIRLGERLRELYGFSRVPFKLLQRLGQIPLERSGAFLERKAQEERE